MEVKAIQKIGKAWFLFTTYNIYVFGTKKDVNAYIKRQRASQSKGGR